MENNRGEAVLHRRTPGLGRALGRGGPRPSLLFPFNHPHDPLLRQVAAWIAYPPPFLSTEVVLDSAQLDEELVIELERGIRTRVIVFEAMSRKPVPGAVIRTKTETLATTDERGVAWIDGPVRGGFLEVRTEGTPWTPLGSSFHGEELPMAAAGWYFLLERRSDPPR